MPICMAISFVVAWTVIRPGAHSHWLGLVMFA